MADTMRVRLLVPVADDTPGAVIEVPVARAQTLIRTGYAETAPDRPTPTRERKKE